MKILLTGGQGFLGEYIYRELHGLAQTDRLGRREQNELVQDIRDEFEVQNSYDYVLHAAGKAHSFPKTEEETRAFFDINTRGTGNLLKSLESSNLSGFVFISSVSVYGLEKGKEVTENYSLNGHSAYAKSKIEAEILVSDWCIHRQVPFLILRLPLIAGKNPPGNLGDMISAMRNQRYFGIGKGKARRSIVHAEDIAGLISKWISNPVKVSGIFNITDGNHPEFREIEAKISMDFELKYLIRIPEIVARTIAFIFGWIRGFPLNKIRLEKMLNSLTFNDDKARAHLAWKPESALKRSWI